MSRRIMGALPAALLLFGLAIPAIAQDRLAEGTWTGTVFTPDGEVIELEYVVSYEDDMLSIELIPPPEMSGSVMAEEPMFDEGMLMFTINVGETISCSLAAQDDGSLEGDCIDSSGEPAVMSMLPPVDGVGRS